LAVTDYCHYENDVHEPDLKYWLFRKHMISHRVFGTRYYRRRCRHGILTAPALSLWLLARVLFFGLIVKILEILKWSTRAQIAWLWLSFSTLSTELSGSLQYAVIASNPECFSPALPAGFLA
jgi:hypothetical protein